MSEHFIGGVGKEYTWTLVSEHPFVVFNKSGQKFVGYESISEVTPFLDSSEHVAYVFSERECRWKEIHFSTEGLGATKPAIGFSPN